MILYLGVDAGGTGSRWTFLDHSETVVARGVGPAIQAHVQGTREAGARLRALVSAAIAGGPGRPAAAVAGVAGAGSNAPRRALEAAVGREELRVTGDPEIAAAAALRAGPGITLRAGTGSFAIGRDAGGRLHRAGGRGPSVGDEGSAFDLVRRAAVAAVRAADGLGPATALGSALAEHFGVNRPEQLGGPLTSLPTAAIAAALSVVAACAEHDDVARQVLATGAEALADLCAAVARALNLADDERVVFLGGGALRHCHRYRDATREALARRGLTPLPGHDTDAALGAAHLARALHLHHRPLCDWLHHGPTA